MSWVAFIVPILVFVIVLRLIDYQRQSDKDKLKLLEQAIKSGELDAATRDKLVAQVSGQRVRNQEGKAVPATPTKAWSAGLFAKLILLLGWLSLFGGIGCGIYLTLDNDPDAEIAAIILFCLGIAFITYPYAVTDLEYRRARAEQNVQKLKQKGQS